MAQFPCIKCGTLYEEQDEEAYLCPKCLEEKVEIAKQIDAKRVGINPNEKTEGLLQRYNSLPKSRGFVNAKDLMSL